MSIKKNDVKQGIAIIGMSCRFPGANNPGEFWEVIADGKNRFTAIPEERQEKFDFRTLKTPRGAFLENPFFFDNTYFKISKNEALAMDPQQRIMLELALETKENACLQDFKDRNVGVFIGANQRAYVESMSTLFYRRQLIDRVRELKSLKGIAPEIRAELFRELAALEQTQPIDASTLTGNISNMISSRISHEFNLNGPSLTIDTACSSSLVAVHLACESLYKKECNLVYSGGVNLNLAPAIFFIMEAAEVISPSGTCIPFSQESDGILLGEGAGLVLLKRLEDAINDGDQILAVIKGSGMNNDGRSLGIMAPSWKGQLRLLESVYSECGYNPANISLIEAHGTSTRIGDSVEITVLENFFARYKNTLSIGAVKSNIGHSLGASGIAGLIKAVLAIKNKQLPPSLFGNKVNPKWNLEEKGFKIQDKLEEWNPKNLRAAGISSFGFGGTNAHVIIEEPDPAIVISKQLQVYTQLKQNKFVYDLFPGLELKDQSLFSLSWNATGLTESQQLINHESWLLFCDKNQVHLKELLINSGLNCILVLPGNAFTRLDESTFIISPSNENHLRWLFEGLEKDKSYGLLYSPFQNDKEDANETVSEMLFIKHLFKNGSNLLTGAKAWCISYNAYKIDLRESVSPHQHSLSSLFSAALNENSAMQGGIIDLKMETEADIALIPKLIRQNHTGPLVIRKNKNFEPSLSPANPSDISRKKTDIKSNGVYLIIGGSSGIGEEIAKYINENFAVKIIISGTRPLMELSEQIRSKLGADIEYVQASVTEKAALKILIEGIFEKYGKLNGIIFSAGAISYGTLKTTIDQDFEKTVKVKLNGVQNLHEAISEHEIDFVYLISSASSLSPSWAYGMAGYAACNAYINAFAEHLTEPATLWLSRSWSIWQDIGMSINMDFSSSHTLISFKLSQALELFSSSLQSEQANLAIVHKPDAEKFSNGWLVRKPVVKNKMKAEQPVKVSVSTTVNPENFKSFLKKLIAEAAGLEISEIDEEDSFSNLGVDSISALDIVSLLEKEYKMSLNPTLLFEYDNIKRLSDYFSKLKNDQKAKGFPLLPTQKAFYSNQVFYPESPCNSLVKISFEKQLDYPVLQKAWDMLINRHESLRLTFGMSDDGPEQKIIDAELVSIEYLNIEDEQNVDDAMQELENKMVHKIYHLDQAPLYDLCYIDIEKSKSCLIFNAHHIITDAWSMTILLKELIEIYTEISSGNPIPEKETAQNFSAYVNHFNSKYSDVRNEEAREYWQNELKEFRPFNLPKKEIFSNKSSFESCVKRDVLDAKTTLKIENKAKQENVSLFQVLASGYYKMVQKITGQNDLIIRLATANRDSSYRDIGKIAGCLADSIPLRIQIDEQDGFVEICNKVKNKLLLSRKYNNISSNDYASILNSRPHCGPGGITAFGMSYINIDFFFRKDERECPAIETRAALPFTDLSLICLKQNGSLILSWNYSSGSFSPETITELSQYYLKFLSEETRKEKSTKKANRIDPLKMPAKVLFPEQALLHEKVFAACDLFKNKIAVNDHGELITYADLKAKSIQLANALNSSGNNKVEAIGILEYPGAKATSGILGILAAGCAYVPLDPDWPIGRIEDIVSHSEIEVLLTDSIQLKSIIANEKISRQLNTIILLDDPEARVIKNKKLTFLTYSQAPADKLLPLSKKNLPDQLAYIMYTSGTTGIPKGVMVDHRSVEVFLSWISEEFKVSSSDKFISTSSLGFGGSIRQIFSTLLAGGEIHSIDRFDFKDPQSLLHFLDVHGITIINTVPSVLNNICEYLDQLDPSERISRLDKLRLMLIGGEILQGKLIQKWRRYFGSVHEIVNLYGSTETIVNATFHKVGDELVIPIGKPRDGSHILLINENGELCENGEKGELYIGGPSIARGYYKSEGITNEKFVRPALNGSEGVYYHSGDLSRKDEFGIYHFLGRNDNQIQLYGNRIEPAEIESVLTSSDLIKNASVLDFRDENRHWMVAFVELNKHSGNVTEITIRNLVAVKLPSYMIPQKVEFLSEIPVTHAGKIDRLKLRDLYSGIVSVGQVPFRPTDTQSVIRNIWTKALKVDAVELNQDFFSLGGDSILALEVLHSLRKFFPKTPKPVELFRKRTIIELAACIDELNENQNKVKEENNNGNLSEDKTNEKTQFPLSYSQKGFLFLNRLNPDSSPNLVAAVPVTGKIGQETFQKAFNFIVSRHHLLRTRFITTGLHSCQEIVSMNNVKVIFKDISHKPDDEQNTFVKEVFETYQKINFNLSEPPLFRLEVLTLSKYSAVIMLAIHHIIGDAWSLKILTDELLAVYDEISTGKTGFLAELKTSFLDLVKEESKNSKWSTFKMKSHEEFWKSAFKGLPEIELSRTYLSDKTSNDQVILKFQSTQKERLKLICSKKGISLFQLIFCAYARALQKILNTNRLLINTTVSGRDLSIPGIDRIMGCFARNLPVNVSLAGDDLLANVKDLEKSFLLSSDHQDTPPQELVKIFMANGSGTIHSLYRFLISYMDFSSLSAYTSSQLSIKWNKADFYFNAGAAKSDLMIGIRVSDDILISFSGNTNSAFKNEVKNLLKDDLNFFMESDSDGIELQSYFSENTKQIDSALIAYLPSINSLSGFLPEGKLTNTLVKEIISKVFPENEPQLLEIEKTEYGRTGVVFLPLFAEELFALKREQLLDLINRALFVCEHYGAKHISLAGNLPARTNYCYSVLENIKKRAPQHENLIITTGHSCTVVAVVKTVEKVLAELDLNINNITVSVAGFGSIGQASLNLLLEKIGNPAKIVIADLASQMPGLRKTLQELENRFPDTLEVISVEGDDPR